MHMKHLPIWTVLYSAEEKTTFFWEKTSLHELHSSHCIIIPVFLACLTLGLKDNTIAGVFPLSDGRSFSVVFEAKACEMGSNRSGRNLVSLNFSLPISDNCALT